MSRTVHSLVPAALVLLVVCLAVTAAPAGAQEYRQVLVQADPGGVVVAVTVHYPVGASHDPEGAEGTAHLLGRLLEEEAERRLRGRASRVEVSVERDALLFTLLAPPERWADAFRELEGVVERFAFGEAEVAALRERHRERLVFEEGAPVRSFERERRYLVLGSAHPGAREMAGTPESLEAISPASLDRFRSEHLRRDAAVVAVVGPLSETEVARGIPGPRRSVSPVSPFQESAPPTALLSAPVADSAVGADTLATEEPLPPRPRTRIRELPVAAPSVPDGPPAWTAQDRVTVDREITSTWMAVAWPYPEGTSPILLELLGRVLREAVVPSPPDPGFFSADVGVDEVDGRPVLVFSATVDPRVAARWEERILAGMGRVAESPPAGAFFDLGRRRFRNAVLLPMAAPEARSRWLTREFARSGEVSDPEVDIWRTNREAIAAAAGAAGPPRVLLFGPLGMMEANRP